MGSKSFNRWAGLLALSAVLAWSLAAFAQTRVTESTSQTTTGGGSASATASGSASAGGSQSGGGSGSGSRSGYTGPSFVVEFIANQGLNTNDAMGQLQAHAQWMQECVARGYVLLAGQYPNERGESARMGAASATGMPPGPANQMAIFIVPSQQDLQMLLQRCPSIQGGLFVPRVRPLMITHNGGGIAAPKAIAPGGASGPAQVRSGGAGR